MPDIRLDISFLTHFKRRKLERAAGPLATLALIDLWLFVAQEDQRASTGSLHGMSDDDIELAANWSGEPGALVVALQSCGFIEGDEGSRAVHEWGYWQPYLSAKQTRSAKAKAAARARWGSREQARACNPDAPSMQVECSEHATGMQVECSGYAPDPTRPDRRKKKENPAGQARLPLASKPTDPVATGGVPQVAAEFLEHYRKIWGRRHRKPTKDLIRKLTERISEGWTLEDFRLAIEGMHRKPHDEDGKYTEPHNAVSDRLFGQYLRQGQEAKIHPLEKRFDSFDSMIAAYERGEIGDVTDSTTIKLALDWASEPDDDRPLNLSRVPFRQHFEGRKREYKNSSGEVSQGGLFGDSSGGGEASGDPMESVSSGSDDDAGIRQDRMGDVAGDNLRPGVVWTPSPGL